jgi:3-hydroxyisobutyrate dehydrogenase
VVAVVDEITPSLAPDAVVVDMGSTDPLRTRELEARLAATGHQLVDAPVSGGVGGAVAGTLTIMVGGPEPTVERLAPLLEPLGRARHVGPVGAGHALKALNNLMSAAHLMVSSEALVAGRRFGLDVETMLDVVNLSSGRSGSTESKWPRFVLPGTFDSGFTAELMVKDVRTAVGLIESTGLGEVLSADVLRVWAEALDGLPPGADHTEVARWLDR